MYSDDSLDDEYDADNVEYLNEFADSPTESPINSKAFDSRPALTNISLQDLNEINDLSASNHSFTSPLKFKSNPIDYHARLIEQITQQPMKVATPAAKPVEESFLDYDFDAEFDKLKVTERRNQAKKKAQRPQKPQKRAGQSKSASSYLDRYFQNSTQTPPKNERTREATKNALDVFKWNNPKMKNYFINAPNSSNRRATVNLPNKPQISTFNENDLRLSQSIPRTVTDSIRQSSDSAYSFEGEKPELPPVYRTVVEKKPTVINVKRAKSEPSAGGYLANHQATKEKSNKPRYRPHTLKEFKNMMNMEKSTYRGGLGPQKAPEHEVAKVQRINNYSETLRQQHRVGLKREPIKRVDPKQVALEEKRNQRRKVLEFAATIPKPTVPGASPTRVKQTKTTKNEVEDDVLERLLARHRNEQARINRLNQLAKIN